MSGCEVVRLIPTYKRGKAGCYVILACGAEKWKARRINGKVPPIGSRVRCPVHHLATPERVP